MKDTSGSVFPTTHNGSTLPSMTGLTKREYFAGLAMQMKLGASGTSIEFEEMAKRCFQMADAMIAEGNKQ